MPANELSTITGVESSRPVRHADLGYFGPNKHFKAIGLHSGYYEANWLMASIKRAAAAIAAILVREGLDYAQSKAVFKAARERAGLRATPEHQGGVDRLTAYSQDGRTGLMLQTLLETGVALHEILRLAICRTWDRTKFENLPVVGARKASGRW